MLDVPNPFELVATRHGIMLANRQDFYIGRALIEYGEYCELEVAFLRQLIIDRGTIVEIGANMGSQTVALAKSARESGGDVIAFEPQPLVFQNLCANLALNALDNVIAWPYACADHAGSVWFEAPGYGEPHNSGGVSMHAQRIERGVEVPCVKLDDMTRDKHITLLKIDVEGFELKVLEGARETIARNRPFIYLENDRPESSFALINWLWAQEYRLWWHVTRLFNPDNFNGKKENDYERFAAFNMIAVPRESNFQIVDCSEVIDADYHPLKRIE